MNNLFKFKNEIAPLYFKKKEDHLILGDQYMRLYLVIRLPSEYGFGLLNAINAQDSVSSNVHVTYISEVMKKSMSKAVTKERKLLQRKHDKSKDEQIKAEILKDIQELDDEIWDLARSNNKTINVTMIIKVVGDSLETLNDHCERATLFLEQMGFSILLMRNMQEQLFKYSTPLWANCDVDSTLRYDWGVPLSSFSAAALWPYHYEEVRDPKGVLLGIELFRKGLIQVDPFLWLNNPGISKQIGINSGSWMIFGAKGSGKTTAAYKMIMYYIRNNIKLLWIDPEGTNEDIVIKYHGQYIQFGLPGNFINPLDLMPIPVDNDDEKESVRFNTVLAINAAIRDLKEIIKVYHNNDPVTAAAVDVLDDVILRTYKEKGITAETFEGYSYNDYPILSDVVKTLNQIIKEQTKLNISNDKLLEQYTTLLVKLTPMIKADGQFFDGHTNISFATDNSQKLLGVSTKLLDTAGERIRNSVFYLLTRYAESVIFARDEYSAAIFEEAHRFINLPYCLEKLSNMWLRDRKYHSTCGLIMQEVSPFVRDGSFNGKSITDYSRAIFNNSVYKLFMHLELPAVKDLDKGGLVELNENEKDAILNYTQGQGLLLRGKSKHSIYVYPHKNELMELEPNS